LKYFEKSFEILLSIAPKLFDLAIWLFVLEDKYVGKIIVQDSTPDIYMSEEHREAIVKYANALLGSENYHYWLDWFYLRLRNYKNTSSMLLINIY